MNQTFIATFRDRLTKERYRIRFVWVAASWLSRQRGHYLLYAEEYPSCTYPLGTAAHLLAGDQICVAQGREPTTKERAKAIAMLWLRGFGVYRRTGQFPNDGGRVNVVEE